MLFSIESARVFTACSINYIFWSFTLEERIIQFIRALRRSNVPVSLSESIDAFHALGDIGIQDREALKIALRTTLVKERQNLSRFDELFPFFFGNPDAPDLTDLREELTPEEVQLVKEIINKFVFHLRGLLMRLLYGEKFTIPELERVSERVGLSRVDDLRYRDWMVRRMMQALRFSETRNAMSEISMLFGQLSTQSRWQDPVTALMQQNLEKLCTQLELHVGYNMALNLGRTNAREKNHGLGDRPFGAISDRDMEDLREEANRLANQLRTKISLRQKRAKTGKLDAKATIRANLRYGGIPFRLKHQNRRRQPKIVVICDVSTSMHHCSELLLSLVYYLQDLVAKTHSFAFIDHLEYISPDFVGRTVNEAFNQVLDRMPPEYSPTDLGYSLMDFARDFMDTIDNRTTFIVISDGRNNYNNPQLALFKLICDRSHRAFWINPEPPMLWGTGDSDMHKYGSIVDGVIVAATLNELGEAIDKIFR